ncbi:MAG: hypothetical protein AB7U46_04685 [Paenirhodobacter sp.]|uniref:hypothetical protein n=1 Tax=Paenirhodobacter sp. TaxID=1965326 RepID=UPI003D0EF030
MNLPTTRLPLLGLVLALAACVEAADPIERARSTAPERATLDPQALHLHYADGRACSVAAPPGTPAGTGWQESPANCPGVNSVEISFRDPGAPVILRMSDVTGPLQIRDLPTGRSVSVWLALKGGLWAEYGAAPAQP